MRYQLDLPVTFRWRDEQGRERVGAGFTHDVSAKGLFIFSDDEPEVDRWLHCEIKLPRLRESGCVPVTVAGRVVRKGSGTDWRKRGFAVVGQMLQLCNELSSDEVEGAEGQSGPTLTRRPN